MKERGSWIRLPAHSLRAAAALVLILTTLFAPLSHAFTVDLPRGITCYYPPAIPLLDPTPLATGLSSLGYVSRVGGVAFGGRAVSAGGWRLESIQYDPQRPDGERVSVALVDHKGSHQTVTAPIYDWQLIPIARFASGKQDACLTFFGQLTDSAETEQRRTRGEMIVNYHPAFSDTLLGLRLLQSDGLILYPAFCDLPKENGQYVLGAGEKTPDVGKNREALGRVRDVTDRLSGGPFQSYIVCDEGVSVTFAPADGKLVLTGEPVWHCWKLKEKDESRIRQIEDAANARANEAGNRVLKAQFDEDAKKLSSDQLDAKYTEEYRRKVFDPVFRVTFDQETSSALLEQMPDFSRALSSAIHKENGINPAVYNALSATMRYAALLRHYRDVDPQGYRSLAARLERLSPSPSVKTPTAFKVED